MAKTPISQEVISLEDATTYSFQIPDIIPLTDREFMVEWTLPLPSTSAKIDVLLEEYASATAKCKSCNNPT